MSHSDFISGQANDQNGESTWLSLTVAARLVANDILHDTRVRAGYSGCRSILRHIQRVRLG